MQVRAWVFLVSPGALAWESDARNAKHNLKRPLCVGTLTQGPFLTQQSNASLALA